MGFLRSRGWLQANEELEPNIHYSLERVGTGITCKEEDLTLYSKEIVSGTEEHYSIELTKNLLDSKLFSEAINIFKSENIESDLVRIDLYRWTKSQEAILDWHTDRAYSGDKVVYNKANKRLFSYKLFIHLSDTVTNGGEMSFIPGGLEVSLAARRIFRNDMSKYMPFWKLTQLQDFINLYGIEKFCRDGKITLEDFRIFESSCQNCLHDDELYSLHQVKGGALIFDERTYHRQGRGRGRGAVLRFFFLNGSGKYRPEPLDEYCSNSDFSIGNFKPQVF